jgi:hypothetical protein
MTTPTVRFGILRKRKPIHGSIQNFGKTEIEKRGTHLCRVLRMAAQGHPHMRRRFDQFPLRRQVAQQVKVAAARIMQTILR